VVQKPRTLNEEHMRASSPGSGIPQHKPDQAIEEVQHASQPSDMLTHRLPLSSENYLSVNARIKRNGQPKCTIRYFESLKFSTNRRTLGQQTADHRARIARPHLALDSHEAVLSVHDGDVNPGVRHHVS
jgi:hypothetical protein